MAKAIWAKPSIEELDVKMTKSNTSGTKFDGLWIDDSPDEGQLISDIIGMES